MIDFDELSYEAREDTRALFDAWARPRPLWPDGTVFEEPSPRTRMTWSSPTKWAKLPCGDRYLLLLLSREDREDPLVVPPVIWDPYVIAIGGIVVAVPRMANMEQWSPLEDKSRLWRCGGLKERYEIGMLRSGLREHHRTVSDGWGY